MRRILGIRETCFLLAPSKQQVPRICRDVASYVSKKPFYRPAAPAASAPMLPASSSGPFVAPAMMGLPGIVSYA
jgi:hypothetical protein